MDKVSGRAPSSKFKQQVDTDQHVKDIPCDQCMESGLVIASAGFCKSCTDFLCSSCINLHKKLRTLKDHTVLYGDEMPKHRPDFRYEETCSKHPGRKVEMFCSHDDTLGCTLCFVEGHLFCLNKSLISKLSEIMESSYDMAKIQTASQQQKELSSRLMLMIQNCRLTNNQCHADSLEHFKRFRIEIDALLDRLQDEVTNDAGRLKGDNNEKLDSLVDMILSYEQQVKSCMENIDSSLALKQNDKLFIAVKQNKWRIVEYVQKLEQLSKHIQIQEFGFINDPSVKHMFEKSCKIFVKDVPSPTSAEQSATTESLVPVKMEPPPFTVCSNVTKIPIKSRDDKSNCYVSGMVAISATQLIVTDNSNKCLKLVYTDNYQIMKRRSLISPPMDITSVPRGRVAVTFPAIKQIQIFTADVNMDPCGSIDVNGFCRGIRYTWETLVVSFVNPAKVAILNLNSQVLHCIQRDPSGYDIFRNPWRHTLSPDNKLIYVTDDKNNTLTCLDTKGVFKWVYRDIQLKSPQGVTTGDGGCIYICCWNTHTIHVLSQEGAKLGVISLGKTGLLHPKAKPDSIRVEWLY